MLAATSPGLVQGQPAPRATDGRSILDEPQATQASFIAVWGEQAGARWVTEHNAEVSRTAAQMQPTSAPTSTPIPPPATLTQLPAAQTTAQATETARPSEPTAAAGASPTVAPTMIFTSIPTPTLLGGASGVAAPSATATSRTTPTTPAQPTATVRR
jgi:hypothetical protein